MNERLRKARPVGGVFAAFVIALPAALSLLAFNATQAHAQAGELACDAVGAATPIGGGGHGHSHQEPCPL